MSHLVGNPQNRFSHVAAHLFLYCYEALYIFTIWFIFNSIDRATSRSETLDENPGLLSVQPSTVALNPATRKNNLVHLDINLK